MKKALKTNRPTPAPDRERKIEALAGRIARAMNSSRPGRACDGKKVDADMNALCEMIAFRSSGPAFEGALEKCFRCMLTDADLAFLPQNADELLHFETAYRSAVSLDAARGRKQQANQKTISPLGGIAAAVNKDDDIFRVLREYKRTHPWHKMTAACEKIVDARLLDYSNREKLIKRLSDIGKRMNPVKSPSQIYAEL
jgi:hypothetical protein